MDIYLAATLLEKSWTAIDGAVTKQPGGLLLDAAVMAEVIHIIGENVEPSVDILTEGIMELMHQFVGGVPNKDGTVFIPCCTDEIKCFKDYLLDDALKLLPPSDGKW